MKKYLGILGAIAMGSSVTASAIVPINQQMNLQKVQNDLDYQILNQEQRNKQAKEDYENLSQEEQNEVNDQMQVIAGLSVVEANNYISNSSNSFIQKYQSDIMEMVSMRAQLTAISTPTTFAAKNNNNKSYTVEVNLLSSLGFSNITWESVGEFLGIEGLVNTNDYYLGVDWYSPASWWKIWDWGINVHLGEGLVNFVRVMKHFANYYDGLNFDKFVPVLNVVKEFLDYIGNIDEHLNDSIMTIKDLVADAADSIRDLNLPFTDIIFQIYDVVMNQIEIVENMFPELVESLNVGFIIGFINQALSGIMNREVDLVEVAKNLNPLINQLTNMIDITNDILVGITNSLPVKAADYIIRNLIDVINKTVEADANNNGVSIQLQQLIIPVKYAAR